MEKKESKVEDNKSVTQSKSKLTARPLGQNVLIKPIPIENKTEGGLIIPDMVRQDQMQGIVSATSPNSDKFESQLSLGDKVLFPIFAGIILKLNGEEYFLIKEEQILVVL